MSHRAHANAGMDSEKIPYHWARGDDLLQDDIFSHANIRRGLDIVAQKYKVGNVAYSPEIKHKFQEVLERRYAVNDGPDQFQMPHFAPYVDNELSNFYGLDTKAYGEPGSGIMARKETHGEIIERLLEDTAREIAEEEVPGLVQMMVNYERESWARHGVANEAPYAHSDPNVTLFRNPDRGWSSVDNPLATSEKSNVIDMYEAVPDYTFPRAHPGWVVDREGGFWDSLKNRDKDADGF